MVTRTLPRSLRPAIRSFKAPRRSFITLPGTEPQLVEEQRILPYKPSLIYPIIADVDSYSSFLPYCVGSKVTAWSGPDANGARWPAQADLKVGWGGFEEQFTSTLFCAQGVTQHLGPDPVSIVEALSGEAVTKLEKSAIAHYAGLLTAPARANGVFKSLHTSWGVKKVLHHRAGSPVVTGSEVSLTIDFQFLNPLYAALGKAAAPQITRIMMEAFETRARKLLGEGAYKDFHPRPGRA